MKKCLKLLLCASSLIALNSCSSMLNVSKPVFSQSVRSVNYYKAGLDGKVLLTESNSVAFDYVSLASIVVVEKGGYTSVKEVVPNNASPKKEKSPSKNDDIYFSKAKPEKTTKKLDYSNYQEATYMSALKRASEEALEMGGDAIIGLELGTAQTWVEGLGKNNPGYWRYDGLKVSGMVVRRIKRN